MILYDNISQSCLVMNWQQKEPGPWFNIKMSSYQYRKFHCGDKTVVRSSYLHNGISYTGKMSSLYWIRAQGISRPDSLTLTYFIWIYPLQAQHGLRHEKAQHVSSLYSYINNVTWETIKATYTHWYMYTSNVNVITKKKTCTQAIEFYLTHSSLDKISPPKIIFSWFTHVMNFIPVYSWGFHSLTIFYGVFFQLTVYCLFNH